MARRLDWVVIRPGAPDARCHDLRAAMRLADRQAGDVEIQGPRARWRRRGGRWWVGEAADVPPARFDPDQGYPLRPGEDP